MQINSLLQSAASQSAGRINSGKPTNGPIKSTPAAQHTTDQLDLSSEAQALSQAQASRGTQAGIRVDKVAELRQAIANGTYETPEKLDAALDKMLDTFA